MSDYTQIEIEGLARVKRALSFDNMRSAMGEELEKYVTTRLGEARSRAPFDSGATMSGLRIIESDNPPPLWIRAGTNASRRGYPYAKAIQWGKKYKYQSGPFAGRTTRFWFTTAMYGPSQFTRMVQGIAQRIKEKFRSAM